MTIDDWIESAIEQFAYLDPSEVDEAAYSRFVTSLAARIPTGGLRVGRCSTAFIAGHMSDGEVEWLESEDVSLDFGGTLDPFGWTIRLWRGARTTEGDVRPAGMRTMLGGGQLAHTLWSEMSTERQILGCVYAACSSRAIVDAREDIAGVIRVLLTNWRETHGIVDDDPNEDKELQRAKWTKLLGAGLAAYSEGSEKKDALLRRRLRNAIFLLASADESKSSALSLALCFSPIEALVCTKSEGITEELSRNVATLLLPAASTRLLGIGRIKRLYGVRSRVLHGDESEISVHEYLQARGLAALVMTAILEWSFTSKRFGNDPDDAKVFFAQLADASVTGTSMVGPDYNSWQADFLNSDS